MAQNQQPVRRTTMNLTWHDLTTPADPLLASAIALYNATFEEVVREPLDVLYRGMQLGESIRPSAFHFLVGVEAQQGKVLALAIVNYLSLVNKGFIVYLAVDPSTRGHGVGAELIAQLERLLEQDARRAGHAKLSGLVLETEDDADFERRSRFFQKQGFAQLPDILYHQPALNPTTEVVPLHLFVKGDPGDIRALIRAIYEEKYHLINSIPLDVLRALEACNR
jgi:GNAT superfamily N-acetyltransferase